MTKKADNLAQNVDILTPPQPPVQGAQPVADVFVEPAEGAEIVAEGAEPLKSAERAEIFAESAEIISKSTEGAGVAEAVDQVAEAAVLRAEVDNSKLVVENSTQAEPIAPEMSTETSKVEELVEPNAEVDNGKLVVENSTLAEPIAPEVSAETQNFDTDQASQSVGQAGEVVLAVEGLTKLYKTAKKGRVGSLLALSDLSFEVRAGEVVGFLGPNGAGKSTAIKLITGLAKMTAGSATIMGYDVCKEHKKALSYVGGIIEQPDLNQDMTGLQLLKYYADIYPRECFLMDKNDTRSKKELMFARIQKLLKLVGLEQKQNELVRKYSLGMKQRLGICQALLNRPRLLLLDEPANGLDPAGIKDMRDIIVSLAKEMNMAILVSSHQLSEMQLMCDRVIILFRGQKVAEGKLEDLLHNVGKTRVRIKTSNPIGVATLFFGRPGVQVVPEAGAVLLSGNFLAGDAAKEVVLAGFDLQGIQEVGDSLEELYFSLTKNGGAQ